MSDGATSSPVDPTPARLRLLVVSAGSLYASTMPYWLESLRMAHPEAEVMVVVTRSAERFVTRQVLTALTRREVHRDAWPSGEGRALHVEWAEWADAIVVYPATLHFMARLAAGLADSPALLAASCTRRPVAIAPALPPGALDSDTCRRHWAELASRANVVMVPPIPGRSATTGRPDTWVPPPLTEVVELVLERHAELMATPAEEKTAGQDMVDAFGTGLLSTTVHALPSGGYRWRRAPGPLAPGRFPPIRAELRRTLEEVGERGTARAVVAREDGDARIYDVRGGESVAGVLLRRGALPELAGPLRDLGRCLRAVHLRPLPPGSPQEPSPALTRLGAWLAGRASSPRAACAQGEIRRELGDKHWAQARSWFDETLADPDRVLSHGSFSLGALITDAHLTSADVLIGEDLCSAPWYVDLGWAVGELVELGWQVGGAQHDWQCLVDALVEGYGRDLGDHWKPMAVLRIMLHVHDISAYLQGFELGFDHYARFLRYLMDR